MTVIELLSHLRSREIKLWVEEGRLRYDAPAGALTPDLRAQLVARKAEVIDLLIQSKDGTGVAPIRPAARPDPLPLSFAQQRLWFIDQMTPGIPSYNIPLVMRLSGDLRLAALKRSIDAIVRRHESLRTTFAIVERQPAQRIAPPAPLRLTMLDLRGLPAHLRPAEARRCARDEARRPFDLARGPLARVALVRLADDDHLALVTVHHIIADGWSMGDDVVDGDQREVVTVHHIIADGWSMGVIIRELVALYPAYAGASPARLPDLPIQYADYAIWQQQWLQDQAIEQQLAYWRKQLGGRLPSIDLPFARPRPPAQTFAGATRAFSIGERVSADLRTLGQRTDTTLFMILLAGFAALLYRYTGQSDLPIGSPIANRTRPEIEPLIGFFVNTLVLRADLSGDPTVRELLRRVREITLDAYANQDVPFERLVEELRPERDLSRSPLFQILLVLQNAPTERLELPGLTLQRQEIDSGTARFDLVLSLAEGRDGVHGLCEYNTDLFDGAAIAQLLAHYCAVLAGMAAAPDQTVAALPLLASAERQQLIVEWNATTAPHPPAAIPALVAAQVVRTPDAVAVQVGSAAAMDQAAGVAQLSYAALDARANQLARHLRAQGVGADARVAVALPRGVDLVLALLATLKAGAAYVPLDLTYPPERLAFMLENSQTHVVLTKDEGRTTKEPRADPPFVVGRSSIVDLRADAAQIARQPATPPPGRIHPDQLAYVIYTSGSTGAPKGVAMTHAGLVNLLRWQVRAFVPPRPARTLQYSSPSFDVSFQEIFASWCSGATLVLVDDALRRDPLALAPFLDINRVGRLFLPFVALQQLAEAITPPGPRDLRELITAGEQLRITAAIQRWLAADPRSVLHNHYGPSEAHAITAHTLAGAPAGWPLLPPIGRPLPNLQIYLLDRRMQPTPIGAAGELYVGGVNLARGYLGRPDLTAERFVPNPFGTLNDEDRTMQESASSFIVQRSSFGARLYRTGDLARYGSDGVIEYLGRVDTQVKLRGYRIEPSEVEAALAAHPAVRECAVVALAAAPGDLRLAAYVIPSNEFEGTSDEQPRRDSANSLLVARHASLAADLRAFLSARLPSYMLPDAFVALDTLPLTPSGKIDRRALPAPDWSQRANGVEYVAPRTPTERTVAGLIAEMVRTEHVGVHDNVFTLGMHSLLATRLVIRLCEIFAITLPLRSLFEQPTVAGLAERIETLQWLAEGQGSPAEAVDDEYEKGSV